MAAPVTHFEIMAKDGQRTRDFYGALFDWKISVIPEVAYGMVDTGVKMGINGGIGQVDAAGHPSVVFYVQVEDPQVYLDKVLGLGGTVIVPVTEVPDMVTFAQFADPDGNIIGLVKGPQTPPREQKARRPAARKAAAKKRPAARKKVPAKKSAASKRKTRR